MQHRLVGWKQGIVNVSGWRAGEGSDWEGDPCGEGVAGCVYKGGVAEVGVWGAGGGWGVLVCVGWVLGRFEDSEEGVGVGREACVVKGRGVWGVR